MARRERPMLGVEPGWLLSLKHQKKKGLISVNGVGHPLFSRPYASELGEPAHSNLGQPSSGRLMPGDLALVVCVINGDADGVARRMLVISSRGSGWAFANDDVHWRVIREVKTLKNCRLPL